MSTMRERFNAEFPADVDSVHGEKILSFARSEVCLGVDDLEARIAAQDAELVRLREWSRRYGADLCPRGYADTFGDGMRAAKEHVSRLLDRAPAQAEPQDGCCANCRGLK